MKVVFSNRAFASVLAETTEKIKTETGGLFLGAVRDDIFYIIEAIDPGPKSIFEIAYFEYDKKYTEHLINKIANLYDEQLSLIGLWHRHPGSFDQFSSTDDGTNAKYASMREEGAISALVNIDPSFRITMYHVDKPCRYRKVSYEVGDNLIPDELLKFKTPEKFYSMMEKMMYPSAYDRNNEDGYHLSASLACFMKLVLPYLEECDAVEPNNMLEEIEMQEKLIDEIIDDLTFMAENIDIETSISLGDNSLTVFQDAIEERTELGFEFADSENNVVFTYGDKYYSYKRGLFVEAYGKAKAEKDSKEDTEDSENNEKKSGVFDSFMKMLGFNKSEE